MCKITTIDEEYVEDNTFSSSPHNVVAFFIELPGGFCERIPDVANLTEAKAKALERHNGRRWQHGSNFKPGRYLEPESCGS